MTPQNSDAFVREVDEELRRERMQTLWQRRGKLVIGGVVLLLAIIGGAIWWHEHRLAQAGIAGEQLSMALQDLSEHRDDAAKAKLATLDTAGPAYATAAAMTRAALLSQQGKDKDASIAFRSIAADSRAPQPYRDMATLRAVAIDFDTAAPADIIARLKPLAVPGNPWFGSAGEMTAIAQIKTGHARDAQALLRSVAADPGTPETVRDRATRLAASLDIPAAPASPAAAPAPAPVAPAAPPSVKP